jgi:hypothetical protein
LQLHRSYSVNWKDSYEWRLEKEVVTTYFTELSLQFLRNAQQNHEIHIRQNSLAPNRESLLGSPGYEVRVLTTEPWR